MSNQAFTPNVPAHQGLGSVASRLVDVEALPWQGTRFKGIQVKPLLVDPGSGLVSVLMKMEAGAVLPHHEHVLIEQTWVLEGHLVDQTGPDQGMECKAGQFIWRPAGSRHSAWSPNGGTFLAFFQIPNKFFDQPGQVVDMGGQDWESIWGVVTPGQ
jgi:anti-sigma factor ChrR (cupin superfamily)